MDDIDGNLTSVGQTFGVGAVDTSIPTAADKTVGYVIEYYVEDKSGNAAPVARRLVRVVCPKAEKVCTNPDTSLLTCTTNGQCGKSAMLSTSASSVVSSARPPSPISIPTAPTITLLGPARSEVPAGSVYDRCSATAPVSGCNHSQYHDSGCL